MNEDYVRSSRELFDRLIRAGHDSLERIDDGVEIGHVTRAEYIPRDGVVPVDREATEEEIEEICPDAMPWSETEKMIMSRFMEQDVRLVSSRGEPYPIRRVSTPTGHEVNLYVIDDVKERYPWLGGMWPFYPIPDKDELVGDMHSDKVFKFSKCKLIRWCRFNFVVSPYYLESGGMAVDLVSPEALKEQ